MHLYKQLYELNIKPHLVMYYLIHVFILIFLLVDFLKM